MNTAATASSLQTGPTLLPSGKFITAYHCSYEWHLSGLGLQVYVLALRVSKKSGVFHGSLEGLAHYFRVDRRTIERAVRHLVELGFFVVISKEAFKPSRYRVLSHKEWIEEHPHCCAQKEQMPWSGERGDPLGVNLFNISGGKVKYQMHKLSALRRLGLTDDEIVEKFRVLVEAENSRRKLGKWSGRSKSVSWRFYSWLSGRLSRDELERYGLPEIAPRRKVA